MEGMAAAPEVIAECAAIEKGFRQAEKDGLPDD
jgi:hypothetical protein